MPPHNVIELRPRTMAHVLLELREAKRDWNAASQEADRAYREGDLRLEDEAGDRMSDIDRRIDRLQDEFKEMFQRLTGVSWAQVQSAVEEAVL